MRDVLTKFGFRWGPVHVTRLTELPEGRKVIGIGRDERRPELSIYVSRTGRSNRVFRDGRELS